VSQDQIDVIRAAIHGLEIRIVKLETLVKIVVVLWTIIQFGFQVYIGLRK
jgi:hypothetical protein